MAKTSFHDAFMSAGFAKCAVGAGWNKNFRLSSNAVKGKDESAVDGWCAMCYHGLEVSRIEFKLILWKFC